MMAGMVLVSAAVGMLAVAAAVALSLPTWIVLACYPAVCSLTLLLSAALWNIRTQQPLHAERALRPQT